MYSNHDNQPKRIKIYYKRSTSEIIIIERRYYTSLQSGINLLIALRTKDVFILLIKKLLKRKK